MYIFLRDGLTMQLLEEWIHLVQVRSCNRHVYRDGPNCIRVSRVRSVGVGVRVWKSSCRMCVCVCVCWCLCACVCRKIDASCWSDLTQYLCAVPTLWVCMYATCVHVCACTRWQARTYICITQRKFRPCMYSYVYIPSQTCMQTYTYISLRREIFEMSYRQWG